MNIFAVTRTHDVGGGLKFEGRWFPPSTLSRGIGPAPSGAEVRTVARPLAIASSNAHSGATGSDQYLELGYDEDGARLALTSSAPGVCAGRDLPPRWLLEISGVPPARSETRHPRTDCDRCIQEPWFLDPNIDEPLSRTGAPCPSMALARYCLQLTGWVRDQFDVLPENSTVHALCRAMKGEQSGGA